MVALLAHPTDPHTVFTLCQDGGLRAWDVGRPNLEDSSDGETNTEIFDIFSFMQIYVCCAFQVKQVGVCFKVRSAPCFGWITYLLQWSSWGRRSCSWRWLAQIRTDRAQQF